MTAAVLIHMVVARNSATEVHYGVEMTAAVLIKIVAARRSPAAPPGQQAPPARAAASAIGARRLARGALLSTAGTASPVLDPPAQPARH